MSKSALALSFSVAKSTKPPRAEDLVPDDDWLSEVELRLKPRGARVRLAAALGIDPTQVTRLLARQVSPAWLVVASSRRMHRNLPASWFDSLQARWLAALQRLRDSGATPAEVEAFTGRIEQVVAEATAGYAQAAAGKMRALRAAESIAEYGPTRPTPADE